MADSDRIAFITGGSRGMGRSTAESLGRRGVDVINTYHSSQDEALAVVSDIELMGGKPSRCNWIRRRFRRSTLL